MNKRTVTLRFQEHWLTLSWNEDNYATLIYVDGKPFDHPDNKDIDLINLTIASIGLTPEQIQYLHTKNEEYYRSIIKGAPLPDMHHTSLTDADVVLENVMFSEYIHIETDKRSER